MTSVMCIALAIYFESASSNQPLDDQYAITFVIRNRARDSRMKLCDVVFEPKQFSPLNNALNAHGKLKPEYRSQGRAWKVAKRIAKRVLRGEMTDFTRGAKF